MIAARDVTAVILAGGLGTRLRSVVADRPKALADVAGRPFLDRILDQITSFGIGRAVLCVGYMAEQIEQQYGDHYKSLALSYSVERSLLGTGGALRYALEQVHTDTFLGLNGDSFCKYNFNEFLAFHDTKKANVSILLACVPEVSAFGSVEVNERQEVVRFTEKRIVSGEGLVNAGVYLMQKSMLSEIPAGRVLSLEKEILPHWINRGFFGYRNHDEGFLDIGTPETYNSAQRVL
jgi:NDP-sugar pyrophosphorylase family protein